MNTELLNISITFNERWPREGYMFIPTFLLTKGDKLVFDWNPKIENRKLKVEIEETDNKAEYSHNRKKIASFEISKTAHFEIPQTGLYNIPLENPNVNENDIGCLIIHRESSINDFNQSPFPERYYDYYIVKEDSKYIKKCTDWGYKTDFGACIIEDYLDNDDLKLVFDSSTMDYHSSIKDENRITKTIFFSANKGDKIVINSIKKSFEKFIVVCSIDKINSIKLWGNLSNSSYFISNEDSIYKFETYIYRRTYGCLDELPDEFIDLKIYRNTDSDVNEFDKDYELISVFNSIFNITELEPIKRTVANRVDCPTSKD